MKCAVDGCNETTNLIQCPYCKKYFCAFHLMPIPPYDHEYSFSSWHNPILIEKVNQKKGHYCKEYLASSIEFDKKVEEWEQFGDFIIKDEEKDNGARKQQYDGIGSSHSNRFSTNIKGLDIKSKLFLLFYMFIILFSFFIVLLALRASFSEGDSNSRAFFEAEASFAGSSYPSNWHSQVGAFRLQVVRHGIYYWQFSNGVKKTLRFDVDVFYDSDKQAILNLLCDGFIIRGEGYNGVQECFGNKKFVIDGGIAKRISLLYSYDKFERQLSFPVDYIVLIEDQTTGDRQNYLVEIKV